MRELIFRGKRVDNGEWVEGNFVYPCNIVWLEKGYDKVLQREAECGCDEPVIPETVGQYTGLTDKNGKKIFEGDIVKVVMNKKVKYKGEMKYSGSGYFLIEKGIGHRIDVDCMAYNVVVEIIGNIHDNPELLEEQ